MTSTTLPFRALLLSLLSLITIMRAAPLYAATDVRGRWSGTLSSNHSGVAPFTITVAIDADSRGHIVGSSTLNSQCLKGARLEVTVTGSTVVLAGSDKAGNNMTLRGSLDNTGTLLKSTYILNGSATGGCETDDGTGTLTKR
jgi:hypothetical protein